MAGDTPNLPTEIIPTKIAWLKISGKFRMDLRIPPFKIKIQLESNSRKSRILVRRLAVPVTTASAPAGRRRSRDQLIVRRFKRCYIRPVSLLRLPVLRFVDSDIPGNYLLDWEFHPLELGLCLSQTILRERERKRQRYTKNIPSRCRLRWLQEAASPISGLSLYAITWVANEGTLTLTKNSSVRKRCCKCKMEPLICRCILSY